MAIEGNMAKRGSASYDPAISYPPQTNFENFLRFLMIENYIADDIVILF